MANAEKPSVTLDFTQSFEVKGIVLTAEKRETKTKKGEPLEICNIMLLVGATPVAVVAMDKSGVHCPKPGDQVTYRLTPPMGKQVIELNGQFKAA
ncbi:hypothetical protein [Cerasicoccus fimbriatus]|uniref:hypothetical protein n=1 Tax=Cerasicoccus fimbriatus TaxID=3014554 RepID=UPI0022B4FB8E|nr:hypothetical protein [Cerasicoccus sp. TK19100]